MKRWFLPILIFGAFIFFVIQSPWFKKTRLIVGAHPWIGYESLFLAREFSWIPNQIQIKETSSARETLQLLERGEVDAAALTLDETLPLLDLGVPIQIVLVLDISAGADVIVAKEAFPLSRENLLGKRIAVEKKALGEFFLRKFLDKFKVKLQEVGLVDLSPPKQLSELKKFDIAVTYEPYASLFEKEGWVRLFDSRLLPDTIFDVLVIRRNIGFRQKLLVAELIKAHFKALNHIRLNQIDAMHRIAAHQGTNPEIVRNSLIGVYLPNEAGNHFYLNDKKWFWEILQEMSEVLEISPEKLKKHSHNLINSHFLPSLE